jgi:ClpP class serine protease
MQDEKDEDEPDDDFGEDMEENYREENGTAIIPVHGVLGKHLSSMEIFCGGCSIDRVSKMIDVAEENPFIRKVAFHFQSPGGQIVGTPELGRKIANISKDTMSYADELCCSAALWAASQADNFYTTDSTMVGCCEVYCLFLDRSKQLSDQGIKVNAVAAGKFTLAGASFKAMTKEEMEMFQKDVDSVHADFKAALTSRRAIADEYLEGQVFSGSKAAEIGMTDGVVEDFDQALELLNASHKTSKSSL